MTNWAYINVDDIGLDRTPRRRDLTAQMSWKFSLPIVNQSDGTLRIDDNGNFGGMAPVYLLMPLMIPFAIVLGNLLGMWFWLDRREKAWHLAILFVLLSLLSIVFLWALRRARAGHRSVWITSVGLRYTDSEQAAAEEFAVSVTRFFIASLGGAFEFWAAVIWSDSGQMILSSHTKQDRVLAYCDALPPIMRSRYKGPDSHRRIVFSRIG